MKIIIQSWLRYAAVVLLVLTGGLSAVAQTEMVTKTKQALTDEILEGTGDSYKLTYEDVMDMVSTF